MTYSYPEIRTFRGLYLQKNSFTVPDGAMEMANNCILRQDNIISKTNGLYQYFVPGAGTLNNLFYYQSKLLGIYGNKLGYYTDTGSSPNETGTETLLSGATVALTAPKVSRSVQASNNLYMTSDNGVLKIDAYNGKIFASGMPPGLDLRAIFLQSNGWFTSDTEVAYRILFGRRDANANLLLGAPSEQLVLTNATVSNVAFIVSGGGPYLITVTSPSHNLARGMTITATASAGTGLNLGDYSVTNILDANTFTISQSTPAVIAGNLTYKVTRNVQLEFSIPDAITTSVDNYFFQVYRTSLSISGSTVPTPDYRLVEERILTSAEITNRFLFYTDDIDEVLVSLAPELYTNPNSREGELQSNLQPPRCEDMTLFKGCVLFGNCVTRHSLNLDVIDTSVLTNSSYIEVKIAATTRRYIARSGVGNNNVRAERASYAAAVATVNYTAHGLSVGDTIYVSDATGYGTLPAGVYTVATAAANSFTFAFTSGSPTTASSSYAGTTVTVTLANHTLINGDTIYVTGTTGTGAQPSGAFVVTVPATALNTFTFTFVGSITVTSVSFESLTNLYFEGIADNTGLYMFQYDKTSVSVSAQLKNTAQGIIKAMNRDTGALTYSFYVSAITDVPGKMQIQAQGFGDPIYVRADSTTTGTAFQPTLPASFASGNQVFSANETRRSSVFSSKFDESEAAPFVNEYLAGSSNANLLRIFSLRDSVVILKEDGVFRMTGDNPNNFNITAIDNTIFCVSSNSAVLLNNQVYFLSNQGVCVVTESAAQILSREKVEDVIVPIVGKPNLNLYTGAVGYESDRTYRLSTIGPNDTTTTVSYIYNFINDSWTTCDTLLKQGVVAAQDSLFVITTSNQILKERKTQTRIDYCGQNYTIAVVSASGTTATITSGSAAPEAGDVIVKNDVFNRIKTVVDNGGSSYTLTFRATGNLTALDSLSLYKGYETTVVFAPFHAGQVGLMKQYAEMTITTRTPSIARLELTFSGYSSGGSEVTTWENTNVTGAASGWGNFPWGFEPWGQQDAINTQQETQPAPPIRIYIPRFQQRNTYLKTRIAHREAGESLDIQALTYAIRPYKERVSK